MMSKMDNFASFTQIFVPYSPLQLLEVASDPVRNSA
jgi:hypothetical protein